MDTHIEIHEIKRRKVLAAVPSTYRKKQHMQYSLPMPNGRKLNVCKTMFKNTLGLQSDARITGFVKAKTEHAQGAISPTSDGRGGHAPGNKKDSMSMAEHISSYHPASSHYTIAHAPNRRYLEAHIKIKSK